MLDPIEEAARRNLSLVLDPGIPPGELDLDRHMADEYGLTSLNKVLFLTSVCEDVGIPLSRFTEHDVAGMSTLREVTMVLSHHAGSEAAR
ncbi:hypothetical protein [Sphaerisporangium flaviroseum]